jgi:hypothetical protein
LAWTLTSFKSSTRASSPEAEAPPTADFISHEDKDGEDDNPLPIPSDIARYFDLDAQDADSEEDEPETPADKGTSEVIVTNVG